MLFMTTTIKYEMMILLTEEFNDSELKTWIFNYAKSLRKFSVCDISVISRGKHNLAYPINNRLKGNYIQLNFSSMPKYISNFSNIFKMDSNVLRFLILNKTK
jgi:ribosomal protein S6